MRLSPHSTNERELYSYSSQHTCGARPILHFVSTILMRGYYCAKQVLKFRVETPMQALPFHSSARQYQLLGEGRKTDRKQNREEQK
jgi:hypothetical protein